LIHLYFKYPPQADRYVPGDRYIFALARKLFHKARVSGIKKVLINLCRGFDELNIPYTVNFPFNKIKPNEAVVVLGLGKFALKGYHQPNPIIAGIGLMTHPAEWPALFTEYPVVKYLQHSTWTRDIYAKYYGDANCDIWPAGIDTKKWTPTLQPKQFDLLIYNKVMWDKIGTDHSLRQFILQKLSNMGISCREITYGQYTEVEYQSLLQQCRAMLFLCEHESQGFACCEALSMNVPVLAWDQGYWLDPNRRDWGTPIVKATSIPYFDERCGSSFINIDDFTIKFKPFWGKVLNNDYKPRDYILENLTLEKSAQKMISIINQVYNNN
jgi:glycosyltransferase involved in cell wall biosynthesis